MVDIVKALGFNPMATAIILALLSIIVFFLSQFYKMVKERLTAVMVARSNEITVIQGALDTLTNKIGKIQDMMDKNTEVTTLLAYHQCMNEAMSWKEKGEIPVSSKIHFNKVWQAYQDFGDGYGDDPKKIIDELKIVN